MRAPHRDDLELLLGLPAGAWLLWHFDYGTAALGLLCIGLGSYVIALIEG
jgi:hypothetical protein